MSRSGLEGPARKVALALLLTALTFVSALGLTIWRYEVAASRDVTALTGSGGSCRQRGRTPLLAGSIRNRGLWADAGRR